RSSLKPFQAAASVVAGATEAAGFNQAELALMCSSHSGEDIHVRTAAAMLEKLGYSEAEYECGRQEPYHKESLYNLIRAGQEAGPLHNNCSGKHAGMLCLARKLDVDPRGYTFPDHPVQKAVFEQVERFSGLRELPIGVDGCSLPTPYLPLYSIARMFQKLAGGDFPELNILYDAMTANPYLIAGEKRFDTDFMEVLQGRAVTKGGGEAVRGLAIRRPDGEVWGMAVKVLDGAQRANPPATMAVLKHLNLLTEAELLQLADYSSTPIHNLRRIHIGNIVGYVDTE
ncbi:MAG: asparaginase, partial [Candidatus Neomarinimicrobiota bacterium]